MRIVIATCSATYRGRLDASLPRAERLIMVKADGSISIHSDDRAYKPLNWMNPPCTITETVDDDGVPLWEVSTPKGEYLAITLHEIHSDQQRSLGVEPGLVKDGVEEQMQRLLSGRLGLIGDGLTLVRREYPTSVGPVDIVCKDADGATVAIEIKRRGEIDGVEQLTRYLHFLNQDARISPVRGIFVAEQIKPQARTLAADRGIACVEIDYAELRGARSEENTLF